jgi:hypothetical protein
MEEKESSIKEKINDYKNKHFYWPYFIKLNQFNKIINNKKHFVRLGLTSKNNLTFEYYNEDDPNNTFHKTSLDFTQILNLNNIFNSRKNIEEIYTDIYEIFNKNNYDIKYPDDSKDSIIFLVLLFGKNEIIITLNKEKITFLNEYNCELNEFIKLISLLLYLG